MKQLLFILACLVLMNGSCFAIDNFEIKDQNDKDSYSLGYLYGAILKKQEWTIKPDIFAKGVHDGFLGEVPLLKTDEIKESLLFIQKRMAAVQHRKRQEESAKNYREGKAFLEKNSKNKGVKTLRSGLQYKILSEGSGRVPVSGDIVTVHYRGTFIDGTEFDNSYKRGKTETVSVSGLISGWAEALQLMKEGSKWRIFVPPELAYGEAGQGSRIPRNCTLIFDIELLRIEASTPSQAAVPRKSI